MNKIEESSEEIPRTLERSDRPAIQPYYEQQYTATGDIGMFGSQRERDESSNQDNDDGDDSSSSTSSTTESSSVSESYSRSSASNSLQASPMPVVKQSDKPQFPSLGVLVFVASLLYTAASLHAGNGANAAAGTIVSIVLAASTQVPVLANPTPQTRTRLIAALLIYAAIGFLWGNLRIYEYTQVGRVSVNYWKFLSTNTFRMILWPGDAIMFLIRNGATFAKHILIRLLKR